MSSPVKAITRGFILFSLWWLAFLPGFRNAFEPEILGLSACVWGFGCLGIANIKFQNVFGCLAFAGILAMLILTSHQWTLAPVVWGALFTLGIFAFFAIKSPSLAFSRPGIVPRAWLIFAIWIAGLLMILAIPSQWTTFILVAWSAMMLILANTVWNILLVPEWLGYKTRRSCFVERKTWRKRFIFAITGLLIWMAVIFVLIKYY